MSTARRKGIGGHHRGHVGKTNCWLTPPEIIRALGPFDMDPCSLPDRPWDTAARHVIPPRDGLAEPWAGRVWLNAPYGPEAAKWVARLAAHGNGIAILFARTETAMFFDSVWGKASGLLFIKGRLHFHRPDGTRAKANSGGPSLLVAYGLENAVRLRNSGIPGAFVGGWGVTALPLELPPEPQQADLFTAPEEP